MNLVQYYDDCISDYTKTIELLYTAQAENDIEIAINNIINYIFKYNNTQYFEGFDAVSSLLGDIVDFCSSTDYSYEQLLIYKDNLTTELELFKNSVIENNTIQVVFSSSNLMNKYKNSSQDDFYKNVLEADLLIIDDLGTECLNSMKLSELFTILNTRLLNLNNKVTKTIISTNLNINNIFKSYEERIGSRIAGFYDIYYFFGDDLRFKLKK